MPLTNYPVDKQNGLDVNALVNQLKLSGLSEEEIKKRLQQGVSALNKHLEGNNKKPPEKQSPWTVDAIANLTNAGITAADGLATAIYDQTRDPDKQLNFSKPLDPADSILNAASDVAGNFGPWGAVVSAGLKGIGVINKWTGKNTDRVDLSDGVASSSAFQGDKDDITKNLNKYSKGFVGGIARMFGKVDRVNSILDMQKSRQKYIDNVLNESRNALQSVANQSELSSGRIGQMLSGGTSYRGLV